MALLASGCASQSPNTSAGPNFSSPLTKKAQASGFQLSGQPDYGKPYSEYYKEYQNRSIVAPGMGLDNKPEPSSIKKFGASIAAVPKAVGKSAKSGAGKVKDWVTPDSKPVASSSKIPATPAKKAGPELYVATANIYEKAGRYDEASDQYEKALKVAPHHLPTILSYAHMLDRQGRLEQANELYEAAAKRHPDEAAAHNDLGLCYARRGMPNEAIKALSKAVELQPKRALYRNNLASVLVEQNRSDEALVQLKAVEGEAVAHYNLGYLLQKRGREQLAASHFQRAATIDPSLGAARQWADQLAQRAPGTNPAPYTPSTTMPTPAQVASLPTPTQRPVSYGQAPEPGPAPNFLRNEPVTTNAGVTNPVVAGNRYGNLNTAAVPPTPDHVGTYQPALGNDLQFLPPVQ